MTQEPQPRAFQVMAKPTGSACNLLGGKLQYVYNYVGSNFYHIVSNIAVPVERHNLHF